jgi:excisionase family DNA binding protein
MTALSDMSAAGSRVLGLLTTPEVALRLKCSQRKVRRLADAGELVREEFGQLVRITPESVAAYERRRDAP